MNKNDNKEFSKEKFKKLFGIIYIVLFFAICFTPLALWGFCRSDEQIGNKEAKELPMVKNQDGSINTKYFSEFEDYFTDRLPLRSALISADSYIKSGLFGGNTANVVCGNNGYIFSDETINDYVGKTFSERKINNIARTLRIMEDKVEAGGNKFVFAAAPNKNSIYPQYMPSRYTNGAENNLSLLTKRLDALDVNYADLKSVLSSVDSELYLKRDTHWNNLGALYAFNTIMNSLEKEHIDYNGIDYSYEKNWNGDLDKLLYPAVNLTDYQYYFNVNCDNVMFTVPQLGMNNTDTLNELVGDSEKNDTLIKTKNMKANGRLLMVRDSFARAMLPFLIDNYQSTTITRSQPFAMTALEPNSKTDVVYEIAERNLGNIVKSAPIMEASECEVPVADVIDNSGENIIKIDKTASYIKIYGVLDEKYFDEDSRIFITLKSDKYNKSYEAFPICETELLELDKESDYGFSLLINGDIPNDNYEISATVSGVKNMGTGTLKNIQLG